MKTEKTIETSYPLIAAQRDQIFGAFDHLAVGQVFELDISPSPAHPGLLAEFRERYGQSFDWWPIGLKAQQSRVMIVKRAADRPRTISDLLGADHSRLAELWDETLAHVKTCELSHETLYTLGKESLAGPTDRLAQFIMGLRRHIRMEEELLFPFLEERAGLPTGAGPTAVMRVEHRQIEAALGELEEVLPSGSCATIIQTVEGQPVHLTVLLSNHDAKEGNILYPLADRIASADEVRELVSAMQAL
jgi:hemerythrin-like domain-containing protein